MMVGNYFFLFNDRAGRRLWRACAKSEPATDFTVLLVLLLLRSLEAQDASLRDVVMAGFSSIVNLRTPRR